MTRGADPTGEEPDPLTHLEPDQLRAERLRALPRAPLSPRVVALLWLLRVSVLVLGAMVVYVFVHDLSA